jgi:raffinose/stachyose/melibiose transport system substrate-binding protein
LAGAATSAPAAAAPAKPAESGPVTINVIAWNSGSSAEAFKNAMAGINDKFKATKPNVTVNFEPLGQGPTWTNAQMSRIAGQTADVTATYGFAPQDIINFQPDNQFIDLSGLDSLKNFDQTNVTRFMTWKGKVWQMTLSYVGHLVWTNEDMLAKYNLKAPTTYAEWNSMCETLKSNKEQAVFLAAKPQTALSRIASQAEMNVGRPKHPNFFADMIVRGKADFTTPEWIESFKRAKDFIKAYVDPAYSGIDYPTGAGLFATGKYAMWPEGSFSGGDIMAAKPTYQKLGAFNAAFGDDKDANAVQPVYGDLGWAGLRYSKNAGIVTDGRQADRPGARGRGAAPEEDGCLTESPGLPRHDIRHQLGRVPALRPVHARDVRDVLPEELGRLPAPVAEVHRHVRRRLGEAVLQLIR